MRNLILLNGTAAAIFFCGLLSPLTPSYGDPSVANVVLFSGSPVLLLLVCAVCSERANFRAWFVIHSVAVIVATGGLLSRQANLAERDTQIEQAASMDCVAADTIASGTK